MRARDDDARVFVFCYSSLFYGGGARVRLSRTIPDASVSYLSTPAASRRSPPPLEDDAKSTPSSHRRGLRRVRVSSPSRWGRLLDPGKENSQQENYKCEFLFSYFIFFVTFGNFDIFRFHII